MKIDWKTTLPAWIAAVAALAKAFGVEINQELQNALVLVLLFVIGLFATSRGVNE